jgi:hypothetical protein
MATKLQTRNTVFAVMKETTEGTPVEPTAGTDMIAFQEGFTVSPSFNVLANSELQSSIGASKDSLGFSEPSVSVSHYMRGSGVVATEAGYGELLESALGQVAIAATEYDTVAGSTVSVIKVDTGEGATFAVGECLLIKLGTGYFMRNIASISGDDLTLAQQLPTGTTVGTGVSLGRAVHYTAVNEDHPTLSFFGYRANKGALELVTGSRVTSMTVSVDAGEFINGSFDLEGIKYAMDPVIITASNKFLDFTDSGASTFAVSVAEGLYLTPYDLASSLETAMNSAGSGVDTYTVTYDDTTSKFTIAESGSNNFSLLWNSGANTANTIGAATALSFDVSADDTGAATYEADNAKDWSAGYTPSYDAADPLVAKNLEVMLGDSEDVACFEASNVTINFSNTKADVTSLCAETGKSGTQFTAREVTVDVSGYLEVGQVEEFKRFKDNDEIIFTLNTGEKSGGNWVESKTVNYHIPSATITSHELTDGDGIVKLDLTLKAFVKNGASEFHLNML